MCFLFKCKPSPRFLVTQTGHKNVPEGEIADNLRNTIKHFLSLEEAAVEPGCSIQVTSGYRSPEVNFAVGGVKGSRHLLGLAVDFHCDEPADWIVRMHNELVGFNHGPIHKVIAYLWKPQIHISWKESRVSEYPPKFLVSDKPGSYRKFDFKR
jgi:hypothetical protein